MLLLCVKSLIIKGSVRSLYKSDDVGTCQCREGLHALPRTMFDLFLSKQLDHLSAVGSFISGWVIFLWKGMKPFPAPGVRHPISPKDPYEYLIIKGCIWSQLKE